MNLRLQKLDAARYAQIVLPLTHELWGVKETFEDYVRRNTNLANSAYGKKHFSTHALADGENIVASFKRYEREAIAGGTALRSIGLGAVFTLPQYRGRGYATAMLALALDAARAQHLDFAFLFTDIHPHFYEQLGFVELPSRSVSVRADTLPAQRVAIERVTKRDWYALRACFAAMDTSRWYRFTRSAAVWNVIALREEMGDHFFVRHREQIVAYVLGHREPKHDAYVLNEIAFCGDAGAAAIGPLLRNAAGDLQRITGWLPPMPARAALPRGAVRKRGSALFMVCPLTEGAREFVRAAQQKNAGDTPWKADHV